MTCPQPLPSTSTFAADIQSCVSCYQCKHKMVLRDCNVWLEFRTTAGIICLIGVWSCEYACMHVAFASCFVTAPDVIDVMVYVARSFCILHACRLQHAQHDHNQQAMLCWQASRLALCCRQKSRDIEVDLWRFEVSE